MATKKEPRYFIVNPAGAIHEVNREQARERLQQIGYRKATKAEVDQLEAAGGRQVWDQPLCQPWSPEPEPAEE